MRGFTLIEFVATLIIIAILAIAVFPRTPAPEAITIKGRAEQLASDIRYVQTLSMTRGARFCITIAGVSYELQTTTADACNTLPATREPHAGGLDQPIPLCSGCTVTTNFGGTLVFDGKGAPYTDATTLLASDGDITIADAGGSRTVRVSPTTGRVVLP